VLGFGWGKCRRSRVGDVLLYFLFSGLEFVVQGCFCFPTVEKGEDLVMLIFACTYLDLKLCQSFLFNKKTMQRPAQPISF
jgi:hypothetical protein